MNNREEIIEMLYILKEQAFSVSNDKNTTVLDNISHDSFDFVITSAIAKLKEDGGMWQ